MKGRKLAEALSSLIKSQLYLPVSFFYEVKTSCSKAESKGCLL